MNPRNPLEDIEPEGFDIDKLVPPKIMRLTQHYHNLIYIRYFFETIGQQPPDWIKGEMTRVDREVQRELDSELGQGGLLFKEKKDEAGKS